jgi:hypothetical protein
MALWDDEDRRAELGRMGMARAQQFSWHRAARETLKVYRRAVDRIVPRAEPLAPSRYTPPADPTPAISLAALDPDAPRPCLRCGTALLPGDLQIGVSARSADSEQPGTRMAPRIWSCPRCGYVELVNETHQAVNPEHVSADVELPVQSAYLAVVSEADDMAGEVVADPASTQPAELELPQVLVEQPPSEYLVEASTWLEDTADEELADAPAALQEEPSASSAPVEADPDEELVDAPAALIETQADEQLAQASISSEDTMDEELADVPTASVAAEPNEELADAPVVLESEPAASGAPVASESLEELVALEAGAGADSSGQESAELPDLIMPDMPSGAPGLPPISDDSDPGVIAGGTRSSHSSKSPNGSALKSRSGREARRQQSGGEPAAKSSAKRRSSGSKRKQTT